MTKMQLDRTWTFKGRSYGPGEADVPDDAAEAIGQKLDAEQQGDQRSAPADDQPKRGKK